MFLDKEKFVAFFNEKEITWLGVDFSKAVFSLPDFDLPRETMQIYFNEWNMLIITDQKKYDIRISFRKSIMQYNLSWVKKRNKFPKNHQFAKKFISIDSLLSEVELQQITQSIDVQTTTKYGLYVAVESFDAKLKTASLWVVIVDLETKEMLLYEKFTEKPSGFGIKTYWARCFYNLFFNIHRAAFIKWSNYAEIE